MAGLLARIKSYSRTPQGRRNISSARRAAANPRNRSKARSLLGRFRGGGHR